ncbi:MAG: nucleotidyltransferase domain-containing protein [Chitinophagaceae bacterium]|nr:nucleotidyltransferase domain-containing protein [Chitinophagaceae bacterium]
MELVLQHIKQIEQKHNVQILYACETGSRAWGFPSPDSDYDVRFIYKHPKDWYLNLGERKDTIEFIDGDLDITGWDLKKCLMLLKKPNAPLIERFQSPVEYFANDEFTEAFRQLIPEYYSPTAVFYHHHSLAIKFWADIKDAESFKLKSFFYLIRSLLSCNWIAEDKSVLPMHIEGLMKYTDNQRASRLRQLISLKATVGEKYLHNRDDFFHNWISGLFSKVEESKSNLGVSKQRNYNMLNEFFLKTLNQQ